jgi:hypothetical protein
MLDSPVIQVIIGVIFIFSLLSVIVTQVNTSVVNVFNLRAKSLKNGVYGLLTDPETRAKFMAHPLIRLIPSVVQPEAAVSEEEANVMANEQPTGVTWVEPELFSETLMDILSAYANQRLFNILYNTVNKVLNGVEKAQITEMIRRFQNGGVGLTELQNALNTVTDPADRQALLASLEQVNEMRRQLQTNNEESKLIPLLAGVQEVADPAMRKALETLLASARTVEEAQVKLETWFNARMNIVSEVYKKHITRISYIIGAVVVLTLNADTLQITLSLYNDPVLRGTVAVAAEAAVTTGALQRSIEDSQQALQNSIDQLGQPEPTAEATPDPLVADVTAVLDNTTTPPQPTSVIDDLLSLRLPLGWEFQPVESGCPQPNTLPNPCDNSRNAWLLLPGNNPNWFGFTIAKIIGWLLTIIAIGQGAPFWFDLLNRIARGGRST